MTMKYLTTLLIIGMTVALLLPIDSTAGETPQKKKVMMSEVYIDEKEPAKNWVELCNPYDEPITLHRFRTSNVLALDCFPADIRAQGGISIPSGGVVVICADIKTFAQQWNGDIRPLEIDALKNLGKNGYIAAITNSAELVYDVVLYGSAESDYRKYFPNQTPLSFCKNSQSYKRTVAKTGDSVTVTAFKASEPDPGVR